MWFAFLRVGLRDVNGIKFRLRFTNNLLSLVAPTGRAMVAQGG